MADYSVISRLVNGLNRNVDLTTHNLVVGNIKIGGATNYAIFDVSAVSGAATITVPDGGADLGDIITSAERSKLSGIEASATADQTGAEIKSAYEAEDDTNAFTDALLSKLNAIEASADVTDATNVAAAGAVMESDTSIASMSFVLDEDDMASDSATKLATQQSIKKYVDDQISSSVSSEMSFKGDYDADQNSPDLDSSPSGVQKGDMYVVTVAGDFFSVAVEAGDVLIAKVDDADAEAEWAIVQANLTAVSIKSQYESNADTNAFTDAEQSKLSGIEASATADQTGAEIKSLYEAEDDTNAFTDALLSKLNAIEASATADQTGAEIKSLYEAEDDTNAFTDALLSKLNAIEASATADQTGAEIKSLYEAEDDTNAFTDALLSKLNGIASGADVTNTGLTSGSFADSLHKHAKLYENFTNSSGAPMSAGDVVIIDAAGSLQLALADGLANCEGLIGVVSETIADSSIGRVQIAGVATVGQQAAFDVGKRVYLSAADAGEGTKTAPTAGDSVAYLIGIATGSTTVLLQPNLVGIN